MTKEIIQQYAETLMRSFEQKNFDPVLENFADKFEASMKVMGQVYNFQEKEKLNKFLQKTPGSFGIKIKEIKEIDKRHFEVSIAMGLGMLKLPGKLSLELNEGNKIVRFEIR